MEDQKKQLVAKLKETNNVLVTVKSDPTIDQLSAAIGLTLVLNKLGKHATAVFSGKVPPRLDFLQPEKTIETNTDSLRDFIISLDKAKADKLRYKVEDQHVKIFITPYKTSISQDDLVFSQGDFNVDLVVAIGVHEQQQLDQAITAHGRILHDAAISSIDNHSAGTLGSINWVDVAASSVCEMVGDLALALKGDVLDDQMATAFLTGVVAETERFSNDKTTPGAMSLSAKLMSAGANQQLVANKLQEHLEEAANIAKDDNQGAQEVYENAQENTPSKSNDGSLEIDHGSEANKADDEQNPPQVHIDEHGELNHVDDQQGAAQSVDETAQPPGDATVSADNQSLVSEGSRFVLDPPTLGGRLTANTNPEPLDPALDPLGAKPTGDQPLLSHDSDKSKASSSSPKNVPDENSGALDYSTALRPEPLEEPSEPVVQEPSNDNDAKNEENSEIKPGGNQENDTDPSNLPTAEPAEASPTLTEIEKNVDSPHLEQPSEENQQLPDLSAARDAVLEAASNANTDSPLPPIEALNAQPLGDNLHEAENDGAPDNKPLDDSIHSDLSIPSDPGLPPGLFGDSEPAQDKTGASVEDPTAPPPVPPPMMPPMPDTNGGQSGENGSVLPPVNY
jgi:nanoRNase/pAp phosphatase (c-di-AMP/oligoRNAs hydrolase)